MSKYTVILKKLKNYLRIEKMLPARLYRIGKIIPRSKNTYQANSFFYRRIGTSPNLYAEKEECVKETIENKDNNETEKSSQENNTIVNELEEKIQSLSEQNKEYQDKYLRSLAERENIRNRLQKEVADAKVYGIQSFSKDLLEVSDIFKKALQNVPEDSGMESNPAFKTLFEGVKLTEGALHKVFRRHGLEEVIPRKGDTFDPSIHEAMFQIPAGENDESGTVGDSIRTGWKLQDRCIRSAQVGVFKKS